MLMDCPSIEVTRAFCCVCFFLAGAAGRRGKWTILGFELRALCLDSHLSPQFSEETKSEKDVFIYMIK
jgi:hypothetical protein